MADPLHPTLMTKMRATLAGERDAVLLEALRSAGRGAYEELIAAEKLRDELAAAGTSVWNVPVAAASASFEAREMWPFSRRVTTVMRGSAAA